MLHPSLHTCAWNQTWIFLVWTKSSKNDWVCPFWKVPGKKYSGTFFGELKGKLHARMIKVSWHERSRFVTWFLWRIMVQFVSLCERFGFLISYTLFRQMLIRENKILNYITIVRRGTMRISFRRNNQKFVSKKSSYSNRLLIRRIECI